MPVVYLSTTPTDVHRWSSDEEDMSDEDGLGVAEDGVGVAEDAGKRTAYGQMLLSACCAFLLHA